MSSGTGTGGFGRRNRTEVVASVIGIGRVFLRDISCARVPPSGRTARPTARRAQRRPPPPIGGDGPRRIPRRRVPAGSRRAIDAGDAGPPAAAAAPRGGVPLEGDGERHVQHDRDRGAPMPLRGAEQLGPCPLLDVRGVDDGQAPAPKAHVEDPMEEVEGVVGRALGGGSSAISARNASEERTSVGREVRAGEGRLAARGDADQEDERIGRKDDRRRNGPTAVRVGGRWGCHGARVSPCLSALGVAVRAHLRVGNRRLRLADRARQSASADRGAGLTDEVDLAEVAIRQAPRHITALASGGRGHRAGTPCVEPYSARNRSFSQTGPPIWQHGR